MNVSDIISNIQKMVNKLEKAADFHALKSDVAAAAAEFHQAEASRAQVIRTKIAELISG